MNCRERGSHARGVYPTQDTSRMRIARVKQKVRSGLQNNCKRVVRNMEENNVVMKGKSPKQSLTSADDQNIELLEGHKSPYHRLD